MSIVLLVDYEQLVYTLLTITSMSSCSLSTNTSGSSPLVDEHERFVTPCQRARAVHHPLSTITSGLSRSLSTSTIICRASCQRAFVALLVDEHSSRSSSTSIRCAPCRRATITLLVDVLAPSAGGYSPFLALDCGQFVALPPAEHGQLIALAVLPHEAP